LALLNNFFHTPLTVPGSKQNTGNNQLANMCKGYNKSYFILIVRLNNYSAVNREFASHRLTRLPAR